MKMPLLLVSVSAIAIFTAPAVAQDQTQMDHSQHQAEPAPKPIDHSKMDHAQMGHDMVGMEDEGIAADRKIKQPSDGSGTSRLPGNEGAMHGLHLNVADDWMVMANGYASGVYTNQSGPDKTYVQLMAMLTAERQFDGGRLQIKSMLSLEPLMSNRGYPNLFATGETAGGEPLVGRQHPHDLFMELAARVDFDIADNAQLFLYGGPVGEPALGPSAFMHRGSAKLNPEAPITHHWFDSSHVTYGGATAGLASRQF